MIHLLNPKYTHWPVSAEREMELLRQVLESGRWGGHSEFVKRFECEFAAFAGCAHGVSAMNGTVTLEMALQAEGAGAGDWPSQPRTQPFGLRPPVIAAPDRRARSARRRARAGGIARAEDGARARHR